MRVLIDTNVLLDVLLNRKDFAADAVNILKLPDDTVQKYVSASAVTDIYYIAYQEIKDKAKVTNLLKIVLQIVRVADVSEADISTALDSDWADFEDAVQNAVAESHRCDAVITGNKRDYKQSNLHVFSPTEFLTEVARLMNKDGED